MKHRLILPGEPVHRIERRCKTGLLIGLGIVVLAVVGLTRCRAQTSELSLCYDRARWSEAAAVANRHGVITLNVDSGRGAKAREASQWDAFGARLRAVGGKTLGYVDFLNEASKRRPNTEIIAEALAWIDHGHNGVFLDDARDNSADADVVRAILAARPKCIVLANPGNRATGPLKRTPALLCESESNGTIFYGQVVIAFVRDAAAARDVTSKAKAAKVKMLALEPLSTYHVARVEYQRPNPFVPR